MGWWKGRPAASTCICFTCEHFWAFGNGFYTLISILGINSFIFFSLLGQVVIQASGDVAAWRAHTLLRRKNSFGKARTLERECFDGGQLPLAGKPTLVFLLGMKHAASRHFLFFGFLWTIFMELLNISMKKNGDATFILVEHLWSNIIIFLWVQHATTTFICLREKNCFDSIGTKGYNTLQHRSFISFLFLWRCSTDWWRALLLLMDFFF